MEKKNRFCHYIKENKRTEWPRELLFYDVESKIVDKGGVHYHLGWLICAKRIRMEEKGGKVYTYQDEWIFHNGREFWEKVCSSLYKKRCLYVFSHNALYDLITSQGFVYLLDNGFKLTRFYQKGLTQFYIFKSSEKKIVFISTTNFAPMSLEVLGKSIGLEKQEVDSYSVDNLKWNTDGKYYWCEVMWESEEYRKIVSYCRRDVAIIEKFITEYLNFIKLNDLGCFSKTLGGQAFNAYRHRFMKNKILIHGEEEIDKLERSAYKGGRVECYRIGKLNQSCYYLLDVNSLYPFVMKRFRYPYRLCEVIRWSDIDLDRLLIEGYLFISEGMIEIKEPVVPIKRDGKTLFPIGRFKDVITSVEYLLIRETGGSFKPEKTAVYRASKIFVDYVDFFYNERLKYKEEGNKIFELICKLMLNSLYGKFGQKSEVWEAVSEDTGGQYGRMRVYDYEEDRFRTFLFWDKVYELKEDIASRDSFIAISAFVTAWGRYYLWKLMEKAGRENVFYTDTDSLLVNSVGLENLKEVINSKELGYLKLVYSANEGEIRGCKDYTLGEKEVRKGIRKNAIQLDKNTYSQEHFPSLYGLLKKHSPFLYVSETVVKELSLEYEKGRVQEDGSVKPLIINEF